MTTVNTAQIQAQLKPGLAAINGMYKETPAQWPEMYGTYYSDKAVEYEVQNRYLGYAQIVNEGSAIPTDTMGNRWNTSYVHQYVGLAFQITRKAMVDNLYKQDFPRLAKQMFHSLSQTKEVLGAAVFNNGFNPLYPIGDGKPVFDLNHPIDNGVQANTFSIPTDLNENSLSTAITSIPQIRDEAGLMCYINAHKLIVPPQLQMVAAKILGSAYEPQSNNNAINPIFQDKLIPQGFKVNKYLTSPTAWFLLTDVEGAFKHYIRESMETDVYTDPQNKNLMASGMERYSFGCSDWRGAWASQ